MRHVSKEVLTLTGYGIDLRVDRGHLEVTDGVADERHTRRLSKIEAPERVFVVGETGQVTFGALTWIRDTGGSFVHLSHDGGLLTTTAPDERSHGERIRAQALAQTTGGALPISRNLVTSKIRGQRAVLEGVPSGTERTRDRLGQLEADCADAASGDDLLTIEAKAANEYWTAWESLPVDFEHPDRDGVPDHWRTVGPRSSPLSKNARKAVTPAHAILNYLYAVLRAEANLGIRAMGMEPGLSLYHSSRRWRDSFSDDLMEPVRPLVDRWVLQLLQERTFSKADFFETPEGVVRVMPPLAEKLSDTAARWREAVAPVVEDVTEEVMEWADGGERGSLTRSEGNTVEGAFVPTPLTRDNRKSGSPETRWKQEESARRSWEANQEWEAENGQVPEMDYEEEILPGLEDVVIRRIAEATDLSMTYAAAIRNGREVPHRRHWPALLELANEEDPQRELKERFEDVEFEEDILPKLRELDATHREIAEAVGTSHSYIGEILRGEKTPSLEYWEAFTQLTDQARTF